MNDRFVYHLKPFRVGNIYFVALGHFTSGLNVDFCFEMSAVVCNCVVITHSRLFLTQVILTLVIFYFSFTVTDFRIESTPCLYWKDRLNL